MSTQPTSSSQHGEAHADADLWQSEDSASDHSFKTARVSPAPAPFYLSTNLVSRRNITLADVISESVTPAIIQAREALVVAKSRFRDNPHGVVDPRAELKKLSGKVILATMVEDEEVLRLAGLAKEVYFREQAAISSSGVPGSRLRLADLGSLSNRVHHDHMRAVSVAGPREEVKEGEALAATNKWGTLSKWRLKEKQKALLSEARFLMNESQVPLTTVAKRLRMSYSLLRRIKRGQLDTHEAVFRRKVTRPRFLKLHERSRVIIQEALDTAMTPLQLRDLQKLLQQRCRLRVSRSTLGLYLRTKLNASYRKVKPIKLL